MPATQASGTLSVRSPRKLETDCQQLKQYFPVKTEQLLTSFSNSSNKCPNLKRFKFYDEAQQMRFECWILQISISSEETNWCSRSSEY